MKLEGIIIPVIRAAERWIKIIVEYWIEIGSNVRCKMQSMGVWVSGRL